MTPDDPRSNDPGPSDPARATRILKDISQRAWEHPADRAALTTLRAIPVFDQVLKALFGVLGEKPIRLAFQANSVRVTPTQFPRVHGLYQEVLRTLDAPEEYPLFVTQTPFVNAGAYGMNRPFIILNSATIILLDDDELRYILAHEVGHVLSGHVLYHTMTVILIRLAQMGFPIVGLTARAVLLALLEWHRKSELSSDRAALLGVQDPEVVFRAMLTMAGGVDRSETNVTAFLEQAEAYRESEDVADSAFKVLNLLAVTHPFYVLRVSDLRRWIEGGGYDRILRDEYPRRGEPEPGYVEDLRAAAAAYGEEAKDFLGDLTAAARKMRETLRI